MTKKYCTFAGWFLFAACILVTGAEKGYGDDLYKARLTVADSTAYAESVGSEEVEGKISIKDNGKIELSIKGLKSLPDKKPVNQSSVLVIETEVNDSAKTYKKSFTIINGKAEEEFTLEDLSQYAKLEILSVAVNKGTSTTPAPTVTTSPTPAGSPIATPTATASPTSSPTVTPTVTASPTPTSSPTTTPTATASPTLTDTETSSLVIKGHTSADDAILVPGGIMSESTTVATPTPVTSPSPTATASPTGTPSIINATVKIKPETINPKSKGKFKAFITLPSPYSVTNINVDTVECDGAQAIDGKVANNRFIATFRVQDLDLGFDINFHKGRKDKKVEVTLDVTGELKDGTKFKGSDTVKIKANKRGDDEDEGRHRK